MKFWYNTNFTLRKQSQRSRSVLKDGSRSLGLFWKENNPSYNRRNTVQQQFQDSVLAEWLEPYKLGSFGQPLHITKK